MSGIFAQDEWYWLPCAAETKKFKVPIVLATLCRGFLHKTSGTGCRARLRRKNSKSRLYWLYCVVDFCTRRVVLAAVRLRGKKIKVPIVLAGLCRGFSPKTGGWVGGTGCRASERKTTMSNIKAICHVMV